MSIADRLSLLTDSQEKWQDRIKEKDSAALTVAAKMEKAGLVTPLVQQQMISSITAPKGRSPAAMAFSRTRPGKAVCSQDSLHNSSLIRSDYLQRQLQLSTIRTRLASH